DIGAICTNAQITLHIGGPACELAGGDASNELHPSHFRPENIMTDTTPATTDGKRNIWVRGLLMLLMTVAFQISGTLLAIGAIVQFILTALSDGPNARLLAFGQSLGLYLSQIANFVSFATEEVPFPFGDWPSGR